jgi:hypothetical protein
MHECMSPSKQAHVVSRSMHDAVHPNDPFLNGVKDKKFFVGQKCVIP